MRGSADNPSRRALLGAAVALPLVGGVASSPASRSLDQPPPSAGPEPGRSLSRSREELAWAEAVEGYEAAQAEVQDAVGWPADYEEEYGERLDARCEALRRLWRTPAPDLDALALKIDLAIEHELGMLAGGATCLAAIQGDAQRLAAAYPGL